MTVSEERSKPGIQGLDDVLGGGVFPPHTYFWWRENLAPVKPLLVSSFCWKGYGKESGFFTSHCRSQRARFEPLPVPMAGLWIT